MINLSRIEDALCQMLEEALKQKGLSSEIAKAVSKAGCVALVKPTGRVVRDKVDKVKKKAKRKASDYAKTFGEILKRLKKKHPKTQTKTLMKRAHKMTKKKLKR